MKVYLNRAPVSGPWGGGNLFVSAFHKRAGALCEFVEGSMATPDVVLLAGLENDGYGISIDQAMTYQMYMKPDCKIVLRVNENDARKGTDNVDKMLLASSQVIDGTVFVSEWLRDYFVAKGWACQNNTVIYNGVARDIFAPQPKLANGKLNIVAHHWSDNRMKGADIYKEIDRFVGEHPDQFAFTYIGRHKCDFKHTTVVKPLAGKELGKELGKHDMYVSASRFDPGPNHILEALSCNLPTYVHADGGGCCEFAGPSHVYENWDHLKQILTGDQPILPNLTVANLRTWQACVQEYIVFLEATWKASQSGSASS